MNAIFRDSLVFVFIASVLFAAEPSAVQRLEVFPPKLDLAGPRSRAQLIVTGYDAQGRARDLTDQVELSLSDASLATLRKAVVIPQDNGEGKLIVRHGSLRQEISLRVSSADQLQPVSFSYDVLPALSKQGCSSGACHGSPSGKGGFRLSLRAFDPPLDQLTLVREAQGRRVNPLAAEESLLLTKPTMKVPHGGGLQMTAQTPAYQLLRDWIHEGCRLDPEQTPQCVRLEVYPPSGRVLHHPAKTQQLGVRAHFSDGSFRDVTHLAAYTTSDAEVAEVSHGGRITGRDRGEAAIGVRYLDRFESVLTTFVRDVKNYRWEAPPARNYIDEHVDAKLKKMQYLPSKVCTDDEFLRRVYLDVIGLLPTVEETRKFLADKSPDKRDRLIDQLLKRPEYAKFWALKWSDLLRVTKKQLGEQGVHKYHRWIQQAIANNTPYDQFARRLLTASGSTLSNPPANFYGAATDANDCVESVSQVFLGARLQCAKCHNHPFESWTQDNYYGMAAFFHRVKRQKAARPDEKIIWIASSGEVTQPRTKQTMKPWLPRQGEAAPAAEQDRREIFAEWLTQDGNPFFAKVEANRIWSHLLGRGIIEPVDDLRASNPPANAELLEALAQDFVEHGFDRKHLIRRILRSRTYQTSYLPNSQNRDEIKYFSHHQPRLLSAEQLLDAVSRATGVAEPFQGLPAGLKATQLPAPDLAENEFLKTFGQPQRQTVCACERSSDSNLNMAIQLLNGDLIYKKLRDPKNHFRRMAAEKKSNEEIIERLYLAALCRFPEPAEKQAALKHLQSKKDRLAALEDLGWAILNMNEFLFQH